MNTDTIKKFGVTDLYVVIEFKDDKSDDDLITIGKSIVKPNEKLGTVQPDRDPETLYPNAKSGVSVELILGYSHEGSGVGDGFALVSDIEGLDGLPEELLPRLREIEATTPGGRICAGYWSAARNVLSAHSNEFRTKNLT